jgi:hypothetical protein
MVLRRSGVQRCEHQTAGAREDLLTGPGITSLAAGFLTWSDYPGGPYCRALLSEFRCQGFGK